MLHPHTYTGPFRLAENGTVVELYEHAWNRLSSMLYIEAPTGVGFSWSADSSKYAANTDASASLDNYEALLNFFDVFSDFTSQPVRTAVACTTLTPSPTA